MVNSALEFASFYSRLKKNLENKTSEVLTLRNLEQPIDRHHFLILVKPEFFNPSEQVVERLKILIKAFEKYEVQVIQSKILSENQPLKNKLIEEIYPILWKYSRAGQSLIHAKPDEKSRFVGGHEFLTYNPSWNENSLLALWKSGEKRKLGSGAYVVPCRIFDEDIVLVNGFFPAQKSYLSDAKGYLLGFECFSNLSWNQIRMELIGSIQPAEANPESLRHSLWKHALSFGLRDIGIDKNLFHVSPGPIEAFFQLRSFFGSSVLSRSPLFKDAKGLPLLADPLEDLWIKIFNQTENHDNTPELFGAYQ